MQKLPTSRHRLVVRIFFLLCMTLRRSSSRRLSSHCSLEVDMVQHSVVYSAVNFSFSYKHACSTVPLPYYTVELCKLFLLL